MFRTTVEQLPLAFTMKDADGRFIIVNEVFGKWFQRNTQDWLGQHHTKVNPSDQVDMMSQMDARADQERRPISFEYTDIKPGPNGEIVRECHVTKFPVVAHDGALIGIGTIQADVTEQNRNEHQLRVEKERAEGALADFRRAEEALRQNEKKLYAILESSPAGTTIVNADGTFDFVNARMAQMMGLSKEQFLANNARDLYVNPQDRDQLNERLMKESRLRDIEVLLKKADGEHFWVLLSFEPTGSGEQRQFFTWAYDITERKEAEEARLRQSQKMDVLGQLTGSVAHDFNNILTVLDCNIDLLKSPDNHQEEQQSLLDNCIEAVELGTNLSNRLTKFARKEPLAQTRVDLNTLIDGFVDLLNRSVGEEISIDYVLPADTLPVLVDTNLLKVSLLNLALNSRDAMPEGGKITVSLDRTDIDETIDPVRGKNDKRTYALLKVSDTGTGMAPDIKERVFEAFFTTKDKDKGTGLGLNTVQDLAQSAGGFVQIESAPGKGTAVKIFLSLYEEEVS